ncbi:3-methyl-2-oxobutanoate hydroxymethyltransferase [Pseudomonas piscis]|uniref:3-methyl-2-oxobutanoate hydroxymethyltransferase n=1 Tax=Pseudomonas piscis TaxID=2614538 RepID=UPI000423E0FD|nr:3-methyl-2-oxobutanoate hydroxymethyltransferase [Pseudomonas piscis]
MINKMLALRNSPEAACGLKINLYRDFEYKAVARAIADLKLGNVESVMVGDSYFMTHLGRHTTQLTEQDLILSRTLLPSLVAEVRREIDKNEYDIPRPALMADIPGGLTPSETLGIVADYVEAGADIIKLEVLETTDLWPLHEIDNPQHEWAIHIGYAPQKNENRVYGNDGEEISRLKHLLDRGIAAGARCVIFERVTEIANQILTRHALDRGVIPYSIFSGKARFSGQSLNVWDAVVKSGRESIFFPPTAMIAREEVITHYTDELINSCISKLLKLATANVFPPSPHHKISVDTYLSIIEENFDV